MIPGQIVKPPGITYLHLLVANGLLMPGDVRISCNLTRLIAQLRAAVSI